MDSGVQKAQVIVFWAIGVLGVAAVFETTAESYRTGGIFGAVFMFLISGTLTGVICFGLGVAARVVFRMTDAISRAHERTLIKGSHLGKISDKLDELNQRDIASREYKAAYIASITTAAAILKDYLEREFSRDPVGRRFFVTSELTDQRKFGTYINVQIRDGKIRDGGLFSGYNRVATSFKIGSDGHGYYNFYDWSNIGLFGEIRLGEAQLTGTPPRGELLNAASEYVSTALAEYLKRL